MNNFSIGNDLMVKWAICNPDGSPFPVATYAYELCYSVGRNVNVVKDTAALYTERNEIIWRFAGIEQNFKGSYSLTLRLYENGKCVFTLSKRDAFTLDNFKSHTPSVLNLVSYCESNTLQQVQIIATHAMDVSLDAKENSIEAVETANEAKTLSSEAVEVSGQAKDTADAASVDAGEAIRRVRTAEGQIAGIALDLGDLSTRVDNVENEVESQGGRVNAVEQSIDTLSSEIDSLDLDYTSLDVRVGGAETDITQTKQKVGNLSQLVTPTKSNLVSAINEAYNHGGGGSSVNVVDGLDSDSSTDALSAKQGKVLKGMIDGKQDEISDLSSIRSGAAKGSTALQTSDVVNNLTSDSTTKALSAKQGKTLKDLVDGVADDADDLKRKTAHVDSINGNFVVREMLVADADLSLLGNDGNYYSLRDEIERIGIELIQLNAPQSASLLANKFYNLGTLGSSLALSLSAYSGDDLPIYACSFKTGATAPTITWPAGLSWEGGSAPVISANKTYEVNIMLNRALCSEF